MRCLFFDCPVTYGVKRPTVATLNSALKAVGGNTGNILFRYGIASSIQDELIACHWNEGQSLASRQHYDSIVLGAANWLSTYHDNGNQKRTEILRALGKPILCIGLGVQHPERTSKKLDFPQGSIDLLATFRELNATVLVRDEFTYDQCIHHGIDNVEVIGCPSNFISICLGHLSPLLSVRTEPSKLFRRITLNHGYSRNDICSHDSALLEAVRNTDGLHVVQDNLNDEIEIALSVESAVHLAGSNDPSVHRRILSVLAPCFSVNSAVKRNLYRSGRNLRVYFNAPQWVESLKSSSLVLGTRIHGCIAALQAGTPSAITTIDSRTEGLAETLGIPRVKITRLDPLKRRISPSGVLDLSGLDFAPYLRRRGELWSIYKKSVLGFGLTLSSRLLEVDLNASPGSSL